MTLGKKAYQFILANKHARRVIPNIIALMIIGYFYHQNHHQFLFLLSIFFSGFVILDIIVLFFCFLKKAFYTEMIIGNKGNVYFGNSVMFTSKKLFNNPIVKKRFSSIRHTRVGYQETIKYKKNMTLLNFIVHNIFVKIGFLLAMGLVYTSLYHSEIDKKPLDLIGFYAVLTIFILGLFVRFIDDVLSIKTALSTQRDRKRFNNFFRINSDTNVEKILYEGDILGVKTNDVTVFNLQVYDKGKLTKFAYHEFTDYLDANSINFEDVTSDDIKILEMIHYN